MAGDGKHALLEVPAAGGGPASYLRLGAAAPLGPNAGDDLAARIQSFTDDDRKRDGCDDFVPVAERKAISAKLHTLGGWRDHCDGNRSSTTQGDKIEVIRGNYRLLILSGADKEVGWDVSGGHITEASETFGGGTCIDWVQDYDGAWHVVETTVKDAVESTYHGDVIDRYYGKHKKSITGTESPGASFSYAENILDDSKPHPRKSLPKKNPTIEERTWAKSIKSYTGSAACRVPLIEQDTWAVSMTSTTHAGSMTDTTTLTGASSSTTKAGTITSVSDADSMTDTTTVKGTMTSTTTAAKIISKTTADTDNKTYGNSISYQEGNTTSTIFGMETTINKGPVGEFVVSEFVLGAMIDATVGLEVSATVGASANFTIGVSTDISLAGKVAFNCSGDINISLEKTKIAGQKTQVALATMISSPSVKYF